ncbi:TfoX/Sxy family protein [Yoonia sp. R2331]|uniref:TfoX/Sxy family protein n=1 Tax=Yoonia sp. R2331 TaxID=3237238 RepID=UPI0034E47329
MTAISTIRNLGPAMEQAFEKVGITTAEELRALGADAAYAKLLAAGTKPHFIGYYVLHMALQGRPWNDCKGDEKKALRKSFDALKAQSFDQDRSELEDFLNRIGVVPARD